MDIKEMKEKKNDVEKKIKELISNFESETGCEIDYISFLKDTYISPCGKAKFSEFTVKIVVEL